MRNRACIVAAITTPSSAPADRTAGAGLNCAPSGRVTKEPVIVLVQSYCDRSGIRNVWGPFTDEPDAHAFEAGLRRAGIDGDLWEVFPLESFPEYRNLLDGQVGPKPPPADKSWLKSGTPA